MTDKIRFTIDGISVETLPGHTVLEAARENNIYIPSLCHDECVEPYGACGICVVESANSRKLLRSCATKAENNMVITTSSEKITRARKTALELLMSDHSGDCRAPCSLACPAGTDCQGYVGLIANGEYDAALRLIKEKIPLPASIGRVCPHPCEKKCRRALVDEPISIASLKSFAADLDLSSDSFLPETAADTGKHVSIIGGGPGGLSCAYYLRAAGHSVTVFDMMPKMGGMLRYGIPQYRLPKDILDAEISLIEKLGVTLKSNVKIGKDITFDEIKAQSDAVLVAIGAWTSSKMRVEGEQLQGVVGGIDFLREVSLGNTPAIGEHVIVCGGGNTAMDACRTAVRLGAPDVSVVYRRTRSEMPADEAEISEAIEEGVQFKFLTNPVCINGEDGKLCSVTLQKMELGEPGPDGRRRPVPVDGAFETLKADTVIMAIGQQPNTDGFDTLEKTKKGTISADTLSFMTNIDGVFAIGDTINSGADIAINAIAHAGKAAVAISAFLSGEQYSEKTPYLSKREVTAEDLSQYEKKLRVQMPLLAAAERRDNFKEIAQGYSKSDAVNEAMRCLECGCREFFKCRLLKTANEYDIEPLRFSGAHRQSDGNRNEFIERDNGKCILCGLCVRSCSEVMDISALGLSGRGFSTSVETPHNLPLDKTNCNACGLCVKLCPTGALTERSRLQKQVPLRENVIQEVCTECEKRCTVEVSRIGDRIIRIIPADDVSRRCEIIK